MNSKPGDLLFWTGTYSVERDPPVTHTMIYLGEEKKSGKPIMVGASDGRTYEGRTAVWGQRLRFQDRAGQEGDRFRNSIRALSATGRFRGWAKQSHD